ncbi:uncharacterized protein PHACADRAFT_153914 [Phanerochaete carnosa HHB-10118-sp]|uniref:Complex 1 LYR protein domain-containing protein n=1 Tax=Phanerochaete carnosa (strain HHB-10118-sp) TaxID=650164 RepID=K5VSH4_PHACS|nr:uncharacterized protein PHACADRAFT_153914 [Phanerochaete carnosa HHB-10118-sp]EKM49519.1 hypothetical protein PHACADRAFT_153914 [Phanerochaete carnosa HHB-10118-sp]
MASGHSGLQKEVLALYRSALRMVRTKPVATRPSFRLFIRYSFKTQAESISPRDVSAIEHLLRKGRRQLETYEDIKVRNIWVSKAMQEWEEKEGGRRNLQ